MDHDVVYIKCVYIKCLTQMERVFAKQMLIKLQVVCLEHVQNTARHLSQEAIINNLTDTGIRFSQICSIIHASCPSKL